MLRTLLIIILLPMATSVAWLALGGHTPRADFVLTTLEPRTLDPQRVSWLPDIQLTLTLFEGLTRLNERTFHPEPAVATHWDIDATQTEYTFHLRPAARWSNGEPVVAEDFRFAWLRALDPRCEAPYANLLFVLAGAEAYYRSRLNDDAADDVPAEAVGIEAVDERTLRVRLAHPCSYFLELTSFVTYAPAHRPTAERWAYRNGQVLRRTQHLYTRPGYIVCNGAFVLTRWEFKQRLWFERNPHYWDAANIHLRTIEAIITSDPNGALIAYETGRVDLVSPIERSVAAALRAAQEAGRRQDFHSNDLFATYFYRVNTRRPPFNNPDLRKALSLAIDRQALCDHVMRLGETPAFTLVPRTARELMARPTGDGGTVYYEPPAGLGATLSTEARVALAREYLRKSGYDQMTQQRPLEIAFPPEPEQRLIAEAIQGMWERVLGIRVELRVVESMVLSSRLRDLDYDVARGNWFGDYMDPSTFLSLFVTDDGHNLTGWSNAEYDRLIATAAREPDNARRYALLQAAERLLCEEELPILPIFHRRGNHVLKTRFGNLYDNPRDLLPIHRAQIVD
jgi:oligopeptide transport system substrate-binding protein